MYNMETDQSGKITQSHRNKYTIDNIQLCYSFAPVAYCSIIKEVYYSALKRRITLH